LNNIDKKTSYKKENNFLAGWLVLKPDFPVRLFY